MAGLAPALRGQTNEALAGGTNAPSATAPMDFSLARQLLQKQRQGHSLTRDEQAYLDRARAAFAQDHGGQGQPPPQGQGAQVTKTPASLPEGTKAVRDLDYGGQGLRNQNLDLYIPPGAGPFPLIVWIHGGGWAYQDKNPCEALRFLSRGYVVASINYRLSDQAIWPAQIEDCKGAIRFLRAHAADYRIDPSRIGAWGSSAGGHLVAMLGVTGGNADLEGVVGGNRQTSSRVQAVCDWFGPTDLGKFSDPRALVLVVKLLGGPPARSASPMTYAPTLTGANTPPFLIMHGENDVEVPTEQSRIFYDALKQAGVDATLSLTPNRGHGFEAMAIPSNLAMVGDFFEQHLKPAGAPGH
jgi:acetyl esterase/lipase